jgi:hypothetical protein
MAHSETVHGAPDCKFCKSATSFNRLWPYPDDSNLDARIFRCGSCGNEGILVINRADQTVV